MTIKVGINGYGRIGRNVLRALYESKRWQIQIVAINDLGDAKINAHLTRHDTAHGRFPGEVQVDGDSMVVNGDRIRVVASAIRPSSVGQPRRRPGDRMHRPVHQQGQGRQAPRGGAKKVLISAPGGDDVDATIVYGVNHGVLKASHTVVSNASCTTNCLAPVAKVLHDRDRHRGRHHDDDPLLYQRPGADRRLPHRPAARALGHACR
jgi:glyceraldehyde 3-phosphate dehydrogenase